jgi:hypothetical protein
VRRKVGIDCNFKVSDKSGVLVFVVKCNKLLLKLLLDKLKVEPGLELWTIQLNMMKGTEEICQGKNKFT